VEQSYKLTKEKHLITKFMINKGYCYIDIKNIYQPNMLHNFNIGSTSFIGEILLMLKVFSFSGEYFCWKVESFEDFMYIYNIYKKDLVK